ncbi:murein biosynthesis integral membrane protein MurJ [Psittacicella hinzii]|nr:murein biosynthesis integral membrane protein MurJ [Psittacicella hinzii]
MKKANNLLKSGLIFSSFTLFSRILGFIRDMVTANLLGSASDIFVFAQRIPNLFRRLFAEGSFSQAFVPILSQYYQEDDKKQMRELIASSFGWLSLITLTITIIGVLGSGWLTIALANGWYQDYLTNTSDKFVQASFLLKITFPYLFFISLVALSGAILNVVGKVALFSFTPVILNISLIVCALVLPQHLGGDVNLALALGTFIGGLVQLLIQIPFLHRLGFLVLPNLRISEGVRTLFRRMVPTLIGASGSQINMLVSTVVASFFVAGSMSWLYYAERLIELPLGIFGVAISTILLPTLSRKASLLTKENNLENKQAFDAAMNWGVRIIFLVALPAMMGLIFLSKYIIDLLFLHGRFNYHDLEMTTVALICFSFAVLPSMLTKSLTNVFYAYGNTKTPMYVSLLTICLNIILNLIALKIDFWFLALSTSIAAGVNMLIIYYLLASRGFYALDRLAWLTLLRAIFASIILSLVLFYLPSDYSLWTSNSLIYKLITLAFYGVSAIAAYLVVLFILGFRFRHLKYVEVIRN